MNSLKLAEKRLISLSKAGKRADAALEWRHDGLCQNVEQPIACCELSDASKQRFLYLIQNITTGNKLWVSSKCLISLKIPVYSGGGRVSESRVREHLSSQIQSLLTNEALLRCAFQAIERNDEVLSDAIVKFRMNGQVNLFEASLIFNEIEKSRILTSEVKLPIFLRREEDIAQLKAIPTWTLWRFWHCLTPEQVQLAKMCGHRPPGSKHCKLVQYQRETDKKTPMPEGKVD